MHILSLSRNSKEVLPNLKLMWSYHFLPLNKLIYAKFQKFIQIPFHGEIKTQNRHWEVMNKHRAGIQRSSSRVSIESVKSVDWSTLHSIDTSICVYKMLQINVHWGNCDKKYQRSDSSLGLSLRSPASLICIRGNYSGHKILSWCFQGKTTGFP